jgi:hypothetical protein
MRVDRQSYERKGEGPEVIGENEIGLESDQHHSLAYLQANPTHKCLIVTT